MFRDDWLLRVIDQLVQAIARIAGLNDRGEHDRALAEADQLWNDLLDGPTGLARGLDSRSLAGLLRQPARVRLAHQIAREQARALTARGDARGAADHARRAVELLLEARALEPNQPRPPDAAPARSEHDDRDARDAAALRELLQAVPRDTLATRYQAMLPADPAASDPGHRG
jgi:hypothetical protein